MKLYIISLIVLGFMLNISGCSKHQDTNNHQSQEYYTCSMHPQIHQDKPGKCPICGMDLIKATTAPVTFKTNDNAPSGHGTIVLDQAKQEMIGIKTGNVVKKELFKSIDTAGRVAFDPELYAAQYEYIEAIKQETSVQDSPVSDVKRSAKAMIESSKMRLKILGLSDSQITALKNSSRLNTNYLIPKDGDRLWIYAEVYEMDLPHIRPGLPAKITRSSLRGKMLVGEVVSVDRVINPLTRTAKVRISLKNAPIDLRPESYVEVSILSPLGEQVVIPYDAVMDTGKEAWVFVVQENGVIEPRTITIKHYAGDEVAVEQGVLAGEKIVTSANFLIDSESRIVGSRDAVKTQVPVCPEGQKWHEQMNHCM